jgi:hypothetical protein
MNKSFLLFLAFATIFYQVNSFSLSWAFVKTFYSTNIKYSNRASVPVSVDYGHGGWFEYPRQELAPGNGTFYLPKNVKEISVYMDGYRWMINDVVQPSLFKYGSFVNPPKHISNGVLSETDSFVRFADGTNGISVKFTTNSAGMPPSQEPILIVNSDSVDDTLSE